MKKFIFVSLFCLFFSACQEQEVDKALPKKQETPTPRPKAALIEGLVKTDGGIPLAEVSVRIEHSRFETVSDSAGHYELPYIPGAFRLLFEKRGYCRDSFSLALNDRDTFPASDVVLYPFPENLGAYIFKDGGFVPLENREIVVEKRPRIYLLGLNGFPPGNAVETSRPKIFIRGEIPEDLADAFLARLILSKNKVEGRLAQRVPMTVELLETNPKTFMIAPKAPMEPGYYALDLGVGFYPHGHGVFETDLYDSAYPLLLENPVHSATRRGDLKKLSEAIKAGEDLNRRNQWGHTPLMVAVMENQKEVFSLLLDEGADFRLESEEKKTVLDMALERGATEFMEIFTIKFPTLGPHFEMEFACKNVERDAANIVSAVADYFTNPDHIHTPKFEELKGVELAPGNTAQVTGEDPDIIRIVIKDGSGKCEKGSEFLLSMPRSENDGWR